MKKLSVLVSGLCVLFTCTFAQHRQNSSVTKLLFGQAEGQNIYQYTLQNKNGMQVKVINYGATITDIITPDKNGQPGDVVLGFDSLKQYLSKDNARMGAIRGRVTNRIANNKFSIDGKEYKVTTSKNGEVLGLNKKIWNIEEIPDNKDAAIKVTYLSKDGEEGFPGDLYLTVIYTLTNKNELKINYKVTTNKPTPVVLTSHSYFNLSGSKEDKILDTQIQFFADQYLETTNGGIPTGNLLDVKGTPFDFTEAQPIGKRIADFNKGDGYDLTYALRNQTGKLALAAITYEPTSGRVMKTYTTEPGVVFYTGNGFNNKILGKGGKAFTKHGGFCLETQHYPDSPNQSKFASVILKPGETFTSETIYQFSVRK